MGNTENTEGEVVKVSTHGQATIPKAFREKLGIDAPGRVRFVENDRGEVVVERVPSPGEMRGMANVADDRSDEQSATAMLREKRAADKRSREDGDGA